MRRVSKRLVKDITEGKLITELTPISDSQLQNDNTLKWIVGDSTGLLYNPSNQQVKNFVIANAPSNGGGSSKRFGVAGEDNVQNEQRTFDLNNNSFGFKDGQIIFTSSFINGNTYGGFYMDEDEITLFMRNSANNVRTWFHPDRVEMSNGEGQSVMIYFPHFPVEGGVSGFVPLSVQNILADSLANIQLVKSQDNFTNDSEAESGGIEIGKFYHTNGAIKMRVS